MYVNLKMKNFTVSELGFSLAYLSFSLLSNLQKFRDLLNVAIVFSKPTDGGLFREDGTGQHTYGRAADLKWPVGVNKRRVVELARQAGFTGIGVYPWGLHVDVRPTAGHVATWGRIYKENGDYTDVSLEAVLTDLEGIV